MTGIAEWPDEAGVKWEGQLQAGSDLNAAYIASIRGKVELLEAMVCKHAR